MDEAKLLLQMVERNADRINESFRRINQMKGIAREVVGQEIGEHKLLLEPRLLNLENSINELRAEGKKTIDLINKAFRQINDVAEDADDAFDGVVFFAREVADLDCPNAVGFEGPETFPDCDKCIVCRCKQWIKELDTRKNKSEEE